MLPPEITLETDPTPSTLYRNEQGSTFTLINDSVIGDINRISFCPVKGDLNNDGFYDIAVLNKETLPNILLNEGNQNNYIKVTLLESFPIEWQLEHKSGFTRMELTNFRPFSVERIYLPRAHNIKYLVLIQVR